MWGALQYIGSVVSAAAFLVALVARLRRGKLLKLEGQINRPDPQRIRLDERILKAFNVVPGQHAREEQYSLVLGKIKEKAGRLKKITRAALIVGIAFAPLPFSAAWRLLSAPATTPAPAGLVGEVREVNVIPDQGGVQVFIHLSIRNTGMPTGVPHYAIGISHATSKSLQYNGPPDQINEPFTVPRGGGEDAIVIQPQDSIISRTQRAIGKGEEVSGWLRLALPLPEDVLRQSGIRYTVSFKDVAGKPYQANYEVR